MQAFSTAEKPPVTVVIDPGHGGEDGGAVSPGGVQESHINLAVSKQLRDLLRFAGVPTAMTREEDVTMRVWGPSGHERPPISETGSQL